jgi:hypothetical protein
MAHPPSSNTVNTRDQDTLQTDFSERLDGVPFAPAPDPRTLSRLSVNSLLSQSADPMPGSERNSGNAPQSKRRLSSEVETLNYGIDHGYADLDLNENDDKRAIVMTSPREQICRDWHGAAGHRNPDTDADISERKTMFIAGSYYAKPVPMNVPRYLTPLPAALTDNPINLMYFHHFLNHTARILVPHDCPENPFVSVLPGSK